MEFPKGREDTLDCVKFCPGEAAAGARKTAACGFFGCCSAELFAEIGYEAATMNWCRRAKGISALNYWSALKAGTRRAPQGSLTLNLAP
jgi:hypothetical protein